jgi:hypothetical protein
LLWVRTRVGVVVVVYEGNAEVSATAIDA